MTIDYVQKLVWKDLAYDKALPLAEQLLLKANNNTHDLLVLNCVLLVCRYKLGEFHGAIAAGRTAVELATELASWDWFGLACLDLGVAYHLLGDKTSAAKAYYEYLYRLSSYTTATKHEAMVWYNLALAHRDMGEDLVASRALINAMKAAERLNDHRYAHGMRQALIDAYLKSGDFNSIPHLLAKCLHYLRYNSGNQDSSWLHHLKLRSMYARATGRNHRALLVATRGLMESQEDPIHLFHFHMLLADIARDRNATHEALGHTLAAKTHAAQVRHHDLENLATKIAYEITQIDPTISDTLEQYYLDPEH